MVLTSKTSAASPSDSKHFGTDNLSNMLGACRNTTCMEAVEKCLDARHTKS